MTWIICIIGLFIVPAATILGLIGFWIFGFWGAIIGACIGMAVQHG